MAKLRRDVHIPLYWLIVGLAVMVVSPILSVLVSVRVNAATIAEIEAAKQQARAESLVRYCRLIGSQIDVYNEAQTEVGQKARDVWLAEYQLSGCQPPRR